jgi:hypothetical protein
VPYRNNRPFSFKITLQSDMATLIWPTNDRRFKIKIWDIIIERSSGDKEADLFADMQDKVYVIN